jgi:CubicO group peptidase (beta-lactamase class C family)
MTKAVTGIAAAKLVESGALDLDAPVASILPEFGALQVLEGFDGDKPRLRAPRSQATVRQLATHTSGLVYEFWNADIAKYLAVTGRPGFLSGTKLGISYPLVFDPGERWDYGVGVDWLGLVVQQVSGKRLDRFFADEIFTPLSMADTGFECPPEKRERLTSVHARQPDGSLVPIALDPPENPEIHCGGFGLYSTASDYMRFLRMLLNGGSLDGKQILKPATLNYALENHIGDLEVVNLVSCNAAVTYDAEFFPGMSKKHSLATMINMEPARGMRGAMSHCWAGALNTFFWFDPIGGMAGVVLMQSLPFCDPQCVDVLVDFEKAAYTQAAVAA